MTESFHSTLRFLRRRNRLSRIEKILQHWHFINSDHPRERHLTELFPELKGTQLSLRLNQTHGFELPYGERIILGGLISAIQPKVVFEFGTYSGATTVEIARQLPTGGVVHTIDLPDEEIVWGQDVRDAIGREIKSSPDLGPRIQMHRCNSRKFDFEAFLGGVDLVYIDASHEYEDVLFDSRMALRMVRPGGIVLWDDYAPTTPGVVRAIQQLAGTLPILRVAGTRLALLTR